jgi:hypothetical protein
MSDHTLKTQSYPPSHLQENVQRLHSLCKDLNNWPDSWAGDENDLIVGRQILELFTQYLLDLIEKGRAKSTIKKHADYLWALGGEIIRDTNEHGVHSVLSSTDLLLRYIHAGGGPYWRHAVSEDDLRQYDSVCRSLYKFLNQR